MVKVSVVQALDVEKAVRESIQLLGGLGIPRGATVVLKPNLCNRRNPHRMVVTDPLVLEAVIKVLRENENRVLVVESDNISGTAEKRLEGLGLQGVLERWDAEFVNLSKEEDYREFELDGVALRVPELVLGADYLVNLPKMKTCGYTTVTLGIKNLFGVLMRKDKNKLHRHLDKVLAFLPSVVPTHLTIVDGIYCMEGNGPIVGSPVCMNLLVAGRNLVSVDAVAAWLMGFNPGEITHIAGCSSEGLGPADLGSIEVVGEEAQGLRRRFEPPFTLRSIAKSVKTIRDIYLA